MPSLCQKDSSKFVKLNSVGPPTMKSKICTGCGEKIFTLKLYILFRVVWMPQRHVIRGSNGNFVGFPRIILKIVKNYPMKRNSHFSDEWQIWPTRNWNLTLNFEAIWGQYGLKRLALFDSHSNIILQFLKDAYRPLEALRTKIVFPYKPQTRSGALTILRRPSQH